MPSQFEEDTYNVKKILGHRTHRNRLLFKVRWEGYTKDWDSEQPFQTFLPSYNKVWRDYLQFFLKSKILAVSRCNVPQVPLPSELFKIVISLCL